MIKRDMQGCQGDLKLKDNGRAVTDCILSSILDCQNGYEQTPWNKPGDMKPHANRYDSISREPKRRREIFIR
jgi:hypothetical protein